MKLNTLTAALRAADEANKLAKVPARFSLIIAALEADQTIHPLLRNDLTTLILNTVNLSEAVIDESYPIDVVTDTIATLLTVSSAILAHVTHNRPSFYAYGIEDQKTKTLLASIFTTKLEAEREIDLLRNLGATSKLKAVPIRISSQIVNRPNLQIPIIEHEELTDDNSNSTLKTEPPNEPNSTTTSNERIQKPTDTTT